MTLTEYEVTFIMVALDRFKRQLYVYESNSENNKKYWQDLADQAETISKKLGMDYWESVAERETKMKQVEFEMLYLGLVEKTKKDGSGTYNILKLMSEDDEVFEFFVVPESDIYKKVGSLKKFTPIKACFGITSKNGRGEIRLNSLLT